MKNTKARDEAISLLIAEKISLREDFHKKAAEVESFYRSLKSLSLLELKKIFPAPKAQVEQSVYDATTEIISASSLEDCIPVSLSIFRHKNIEKSSPDLFKKDMALLQAVFFFFLRDLVKGDCFVATAPRNDSLFESAIEDGTWFTCEKQAEILNQIWASLSVSDKMPFAPCDFAALSGNHFEANESILRLIFNFSSSEMKKERIINELNFVREQQKSVLPVYPNTRKTNFSESGASQEIQSKLKNLASLKKIDFGFSPHEFCQYFFASDDDLKETFSRKISCKCFQESEMKWKNEKPRKKYFRDGLLRIIARKNDRATTKSALSCKFLYPERNLVTHISDNFAVHNLCGREVSPYELRYREELLLGSLFDARKYLLSLRNGADDGTKRGVKKLLSILTHYLEKITAPFEIKEKSGEDLWKEVFDEKGLCKIQVYKIRNSENLFDNVLTDDEITHFRRFMSFLYCTGNEAEDFFEENALAIEVYLIYLTLEFAKWDKNLAR